MIDDVLRQAISGLSTGCIYSLLALALVMIFRATNKINFAQGEMAMLSTYCAWLLIRRGFPYWEAMVITIVISFAVGYFISTVFLRPVRNAPPMPVIMVFVGMLIVFNSLAGWIFGYSVQTFPSPFPDSPAIGMGLLSNHELGVIAVTLILFTSMYAFFRYTSFGLAMRAAAENPESSRLVGIRVGRMIAIGWGMAAAVGAVAGIMVAPITFLDPNMMSGMLLYSFAAALIGGINNPGGAVVGGLIVGVLGNLIATYVVGTELKQFVALAIIVGVLCLRPEGLLGSSSAVRV